MRPSASSRGASSLWILILASAAFTASRWILCGVATKMSSFGEHLRREVTKAVATAASPWTCNSYPMCWVLDDQVLSRTIARETGRCVIATSEVPLGRFVGVVEWTWGATSTD